MLSLVCIINEQLPVVLMHGLSQTAQDVQSIADWISEAIPGTYVKNCEVGNGPDATLVMTLNSQISELSTCINNDPKLKKGFIGLGYSNGGILMRGYLELYNHKKAPMKRMVTLSAPLGGFFCGTHSPCYTFGEFPSILTNLAADLIYTKIIQNVLGPSNYWRDPYNLESYLEGCATLPTLDNLVNPSEQKKKNFMSVDKMVLFGSAKDGAISPWQSAWFGTWGKDDREVTPMEHRDVYEKDLFGLKTMDQQGRIHRFESGLGHLDYYQDKDFIVSQVVPWLEMEA
ncbi:Palmitoyl-protein_thioesterase [Hexamita inflata]|uniref:Palmitoyl-protein thioesterase n=1 Tax=Hexamita inflata TaxID=28002 RepID=A0AA86R8V4_9EUKA|nr:Palmitoyl-protein thioesterase [Hexamita inflata]